VARGALSLSVKGVTQTRFRGPDKKTGPRQSSRKNEKQPSLRNQEKERGEGLSVKEGGGAENRGVSGSITHISISRKIRR